MMEDDWIPIRKGNVGNIYPKDGESVRVKIYSPENDKYMETTAIFRDYPDARGWQISGESFERLKLKFKLPQWWKYDR